MKKHDWQNERPDDKTIEKFRRLGFYHWTDTSKESNTMLKAGIRQGYLNGWIEGQQAMKKAFLDFLRSHMCDHVLMFEEGIMDMFDEGQRHMWEAKRRYVEATKIGYIEADPKGDWNDHKKEEVPDAPPAKPVKRMKK